MCSEMTQISVVNLISIKLRQVYDIATHNPSSNRIKLSVVKNVSLVFVCKNNVLDFVDYFKH